MKSNLITTLSLSDRLPSCLILVFGISDDSSTNGTVDTQKRSGYTLLKTTFKSVRPTLSTLGCTSRKKRGDRWLFTQCEYVGANHSWNIGLNQNITTGLLEDVTTQFTNASVSVGVDLYRGGQNVLQLLRANLALLASQYQIEDMKEDVALFVANGYLQVGI